MTRFPLVLAALLFSAPCSAQEIAAVLSSAPGPYQAGYEGLVRGLGRQIPAYRLPGARPGARARVIVAFGGDAAAQSYAVEATVIACLAPGLAERARPGFVFMTMRPRPRDLLARLRKVQPELKRLGVLSNGRDAQGYAADLKSAASELGLEIVRADASGPEGLPDALRALREAKADALWLAPDPNLVTPDTFQMIKQFSWDNKMPFYAPTAGLAGAGAAAAVSVGPEEAGRQAADLARRALAGEELPEFVYPAATALTVNPASAQKAGLTIGPEALAGADKVIR